MRFDDGEILSRVERSLSPHLMVHIDQDPPPLHPSLSIWASGTMEGPASIALICADSWLLEATAIRTVVTRALAALCAQRPWLVASVGDSIQTRLAQRSHDSLSLFLFAAPASGTTASGRAA